MAAAPDARTGWLRLGRRSGLSSLPAKAVVAYERAVALDGVERDFYVRQLWDWKASADIEAMTGSAMEAYGRSCGWTLARAHARSGDRIAMASYLGKGDTFDAAVADFAVRYADQNERDYQALTSAVESVIKMIDRPVKGSEKFWSEAGAEAILQLRADYLSETEVLPRFWSEREKQANAGRPYRRAA